MALIKKPSCKICKYFCDRKGKPTPCEKCMPIALRPENQDAVDVFLLAIKQLRFGPTGRTMGVDLNTVIQLVKLMEVQDPIDTIEKVLILSKEIIERHGH